MNIQKRIILLITYVSISMVMLFLFGAFTSHGPLHALYILTGWAAIFYVLLSFSGWPLFLAIFILYLIVLSIVSACVGSGLRHPLPVLPVSIHSIGAALCFLIPGRGGFEFNSFTNILAWPVPIFIALLYFFLEWRFIRRSGISFQERGIPRP